MKKKTTYFISLVMLSLFAFSAMNSMAFASGSEGDDGDATVQSPRSAADITPLADEDSIVDPRGQSVKESAELDLSREMTVDVINPIDWELEVDGFELIDAEIPMDLDLLLGMGFPLKAETSYDPYDVHAGDSFNYIVDVDNEGCTPYADLGVDFSMDFSELNFQAFESSNLFEFTADWGSIDYEKQITVPFYGTTTKFGDWIDYDIVDRYYSIDDLLSIVGANVKPSDYGLKGGVGVNVKYKLHSWVTADLTVKNQTGDVTQFQELNWNDIDSKDISVSIDSNALHGQYYSIDVGDWVYHIAQDVTFKVWADIGFDIFGIGLIDETFDYSYTLGLGELTFPEREDYTFHSDPQVLSGISEHNKEASYDLAGITLDTENPSEFQLLDHTWEIPEVEEVTEWFDDMKIDAGVSAGVGIDMPFNMLSYYNSRKVTPGNTFDYNVLVDSVGAAAPNIDYFVDGYVDLSNVSLLGFDLDRYEFNLDDSIFEFDGITTPFEPQTWEYEITDLVELDTASDMLNEWISNQLYGVNPDIQFRAWIMLEAEGYMTGTATVSDGTITEATEFVWDEQFDTQTSRIQIPASMDAGENLTVSYTDLSYNMKLRPGIKLGASVLGGIVGFDVPIKLPWDIAIDDTFQANDFTEEIQVSNVNVDADNLIVDNSYVENDINTVTGSFDVTNVGGEIDNYNFELLNEGLPSGTTASFTPADLIGVDPSESNTITYSVDLGSEAHKSELHKDLLQFKVQSSNNPDVYDIIGADLILEPHPDWVPKATIIMEDEIDVYPGVDVEVPIKVINDAKTGYTYSASLSGDTGFVSDLSDSSFSLSEGESKDLTLDISVPAESGSSPGPNTLTLEVDANGAVFSQDLTYNVMEFTDVSVELGAAFNPDLGELISLGDDSVYYFDLKNDGNSQANMDVWVTSETISSYNINNNPGPASLSVSAGATTSFNLELITSGLSPGEHEFTIYVNDTGGEGSYSQTFDVTIEQIEVETIYAQSYDYDEAEGSLNYSIAVKNVGNVADTFDFSLTGLDDSAYSLKTISGEDPSSVFIPAGLTQQFDLTISPEDIRKVRPGANGFQIKAKSETFETEGVGKASAAKLPAIKEFAISEPKELIALDAEDSYTMTFEIENLGNVNDIFTIEVDGIGDQYYEITSINDSVFATAEVIGDNTVSVARGEKVEVSVKILKTVKGRYKPTINVLDSQDELMQTFNGKFSYNASSSWWIILLAVVGSVGAVAIGFKAYTEYNERQMNVAYGDAEAQPGMLSRFKQKISQKRGKKKDEDLLAEIKQEETLETQDAADKAVEEDEESKLVKVKKSQETFERGLNKIKSGLTAAKNKMKAGFSVAKDKVNTWVDEKKEVKNLADDEDFWEDQASEDIDDDLFADESDDGWD